MLVIGVIAVAMFLSPKQEEPIGVQYKSNSTALTELIFKADLAELKKIDWVEVEKISDGNQTLYDPHVDGKTGMQ